MALEEEAEEEAPCMGQPSCRQTNRRCFHDQLRQPEPLFKSHEKLKTKRKKKKILTSDKEGAAVGANFNVGGGGGGGPGGGGGGGGRDMMALYCSSN